MPLPPTGLLPHIFASQCAFVPSNCSNTPTTNTSEFHGRISQGAAQLTVKSKSQRRTPHRTNRQTKQNESKLIDPESTQVDARREVGDGVGENRQRGLRGTNLQLYDKSQGCNNIQNVINNIAIILYADSWLLDLL